MAFRRLQVPFAMTAYPVRSLGGSMCQFDFRGQRAFQHRNLDKWDLRRPPRRIPDFWFEDQCRMFLEELRTKWDATIETAPLPRGVSCAARRIADELAAQRYELQVSGQNRAAFEFWLGRPCYLLSKGTAGLAGC